MHPKQKSRFSFKPTATNVHQNSSREVNVREGRMFSSGLKQPHLSLNKYYKNDMNRKFYEDVIEKTNYWPNKSYIQQQTDRQNKLLIKDLKKSNDKIWNRYSRIVRTRSNQIDEQIAAFNLPPRARPPTTSEWKSAFADISRNVAARF